MEDRIIGIKEVMALCGVGKDTATLWLSQKSCPTLPRRKGAPYKVSEQAFMAWLQRGGK